MPRCGEVSFKTPSDGSWLSFCYGSQVYSAAGPFLRRKETCHVNLQRISFLKWQKAILKAPASVVPYAARRGGLLISSNQYEHVSCGFNEKPNQTEQLWEGQPREHERGTMIAYTVGLLLSFFFCTHYFVRVALETPKTAAFSNILVMCINKLLLMCPKCLH